MSERIRELELKYQSYLRKKFLKVLLFVCLILGFGFSGFLGFKHLKQKDLALKALEEKNSLLQKTSQARLEFEKSKVLKQRQKAIQINSQLLSVANLKKAFYENPSYEKALKLSELYMEERAFQKAVFWALKANELDNTKQSWELFAKAKAQLGEKELAQKVLDLYTAYYE